MRTANESTLILVRISVHKHGSARALVRSFDPAKYNQGELHGAITNILTGKPITLEKENVLLDALGYEPLPRLDKRPVCPIHGVVHDTECDGEQGVAVWVHPKEKLVKAPGFGKPRRERKTIQLSPEAHAIMVEWRERIGGDWYETIRAMDYLAKGITR